MPSARVVRDVKRGQAVFLVKGQDLLAHFQAIRRIDVAERLVHQHDARRGDHGPAERDALLLPAGELGRFAFEETFFDADFPSERAEELRDLVAGPFSHSKRQRQVRVALLVENLHMRPEREVLKNHLHVALADRHVVDRGAVDENRAAVGLFESGDES